MNTKKLIIVSLVCSIITGVAIYVFPKNPGFRFDIYAGLFGLVIGLTMLTAKNISPRDFFKWWGISAAIYFGLQIILEILIYQPWPKMLLDGHPVDMLALRSIYDSPFAIYFAVISLITAALPILLSRHFWMHYRPRGHSESNDIEKTKKSLYRTSFLIAGIILFCTIVFGHLSNYVWYWLHQNGYNSDWGYMLTGVFDIPIIIIILATSFAVFHRRRRPITLHHIYAFILSFITYFIIMVGFEIIWYRPWELQTYTDEFGGTMKYNSYKLDAIYTPNAILPMIVAIFIFYLLTLGIIAIWTKIKWPGKKLYFFKKPLT